MQTGTPRRAPDGSLLGLIGSCLDIHDRREAERVRLQIEEQLRRSQNLESLGVLAGGIAHDFNNLLMMILGNAELLKSELPNHLAADRALSDIVLTAQRASELCRQMLTYAGKTPPSTKAVGVGALMEEMAHLMRVSIPRSIELVKSFEDEGIFVQADPAQMRQVAMNLVLNAVDAIGKESSGRISIRTTRVSLSSIELQGLLGAGDATPGEFIALSVADTGCGMSPEVQARIFEPFFTTKFTGRGLGLSMILGIVKGHRGGFRVESVEGVGSTFTIYLPVAGAAIPTIPMLAASHDSAPSNSIGCGLLLLVDDELMVLRVGEAMLKRLGHQTMAFQDPVAALAEFRASPGLFDAVMLDLAMPTIPGDRLLREIRAIRPDIPAIVCSGQDCQAASNALLGFGDVHCLTKPFSLSELKDALREALG
ncbi:response regulator [bacterium]|nr:response regulator [bacterium]